MNTSEKEKTYTQTPKLNNKNQLSTGNLFLDKLISGVSLGTIILLIEDDPSSIYESLLKYFIAEGIIKKQKIFYYYNNENSNQNIIEALPYKSTQVESIINAKRVNETKSNEMRIAWRYENIKYSTMLEDIVKSSEYVFDLSRQLQETYLIDKNKSLIKKNFIGEKVIMNDDNNNVNDNEKNQNKNENDYQQNPIDYLRELTQGIIKDYQSFTEDIEEDEIRICRFVAPNLFLNDSNANKDFHTEEFITKFKVQLNCLKNVIRSTNGILFVTLNKDFVSNEIYKLLFYFSDYVFTLKSFTMDPQKMEDYDGLFYINKLPRVCNMKTIELETDTYGVIVEKRKLVIEKIDIGLEIDRNTKVKEKDLPASQAMCGQEKYKKDFEF
jgi:hypothetical protein